MFEHGIHLSPEAFRDLPDSVQRLDVREVWEANRAQLPGSILIPLGELVDRVGELDATRPVVAYCHHGMRSLQALHFLRSVGMTDLAHLSGGIEAYSRMDSTIPRY